MAGLALLVASIAWWNQTPKQNESAEKSLIAQAAQQTEALDRVPPRVFAEIAPGEPADFDQKIKQLHERLEQIEATDTNISGSPSSDRWDNELRLMHEQLDQLLP